MTGAMQVTKSCREGMILKNNHGEEFVVLKYVSAKEVYVKFLDKYGYTFKAWWSNIERGVVQNIYRPVVCGVGIVGIKGVNSKKHEYHQAYVRWRSMLKRVFANSDTDKNGKYKHYRHVGVCTAWLYFPNFLRWYKENVPSDGINSDWHLDKDLLQRGVKFKVYSPSTCIFLPSHANAFLTNEKTTTKYGFSGVKPIKGKWVACGQIFNGGNKTIGTFKIKEEAQIAYLKFRLENTNALEEYLVCKDVRNKRAYEALHAYKMELTENANKLKTFVDEWGLEMAE